MRIKFKKFLIYLFGIDLAREGKEEGLIYYFLYSFMAIYVSTMTLTDDPMLYKFYSFLITATEYEETAKAILFFAGVILVIFMWILLRSILRHSAYNITERIKKIWEK